jgi:hypothetical protein
LRKAQVMRVRWLARADQAGLRGDEAQMFSITAASPALEGPLPQRPRPPLPFRLTERAMMKPLVAAAVAAELWTPEASGQTILQKNDWQAKSFETYLPPPAQGVPWLDLDVRTKLPKQDLPIGWQADAVLPFVLHPISPDAQVWSNTASDVRRI